MKLDSPFKYIGKFDINPLLNYLPPTSDPLWVKNTFRQNVYSDHKDTKSIIFIWEGNNDGDNNIVDQELINSPLGVEVIKIVDKIKLKYGNSLISKLMIVSMAPNGFIDYHKDGGFLIKMRRIHLPLVTSKDCIFEIDKTRFSFPEGFCFEFDNTKIHAVNNKSKKDRIHIILDLKIKDGK